MRRRTVIILVGVLAVGGLGASLATVFRPFEGGPRYRGMPVSYWRHEVHEYLKNETAFASPSSLISRFKSFLGLRDGGEPAILGNDPRATPLLLELLRDDDLAVCAQAYHALERLDMDALMSGLMNLFDTGKREQRTFAARGTILAFCENPKSQAWSDLSLRMAMPVLIESLKDKTDPDRASSATFLGMIETAEQPLCRSACLPVHPNSS